MLSCSSSGKSSSGLIPIAQTTLEREVAVAIINIACTISGADQPSFTRACDSVSDSGTRSSAYSDMLPAEQPRLMRYQRGEVAQARKFFGHMGKAVQPFGVPVRQ
jgi:hypothetical protein